MAKPCNSFWIKYVVIIVLFGVLDQMSESYVLTKQGSTQITNVRAKRTTLLNLKIWDFGVVPYEFGANIGLKEIAKIQAAMGHWEKHTCITFIKRNRTENADFVKWRDYS